MARIRRMFCAKKLITPEQSIANGALLAENSSILAVGGISGFRMEKEIEVYDFPDAYITPGFIDTHIHGAGGFDCSSVGESVNPFSSMCAILCSRGVTGFFPTVVADDKTRMLKNLELLAAEMKKPVSGAEPIGINIEGPFLNPDKCGAQPAEFLSQIDLGFARELLSAGGGLVKLMTFAPELPGADKLIELLCENNVMPAMGHSCADEFSALRAVDAGARYCTHLFNGMSSLHQRDIGLIGIALTDRRVTVELIIDGVHVHPRIVDLVCRCKRVDRLIGISDGTMASGMPNGIYTIGPAKIVVRDGLSQTEEGTLAGSSSMLDTGWHSLMSCGHLSENDAAQSVTANPARVFGFDDRGVLLPTRRADLAIFEMKTNRVLMTVRGGEIIYRDQAQ
ncbi:MAG: N-acetylglucosamine-6-phosphate deacetylase [Lentisphaeria bacterium]|nr:N-acetylglucosamine-6-phosphate deacetylase [Lentisphaeria bacterium]